MTDDDRQSKDLDALEGDIRASRARIGGTVDALRDRTSRLRDSLTRWSPQTLMENSMKHTYSPSTPDTPSQRANLHQTDRYESGQTVHYNRRQSQSSGSVLDSVTGNPIPLALVGIGLGWLALSSTGYDRRIARSSTVRNARHRMGDAVDYARETLSDAGESVRNAASSAYDSASGAVSSAYDSASGTVSGMVGGSDNDHVSGRGDLHNQRQSQGYVSRGVSRLSSMTPSTDHLRHRAHDMSTGFWDLIEDHPIVAGAMGVALGAAIGAALPGTRYEKQWVGDYADEATERAKAIAMDALDRGTRAAQAAAQTVVESAKEDVRDVVTEATNAAREEVKKPG
ncbi:hypothetical protein GBZ48_23100 [Azospirillum melinis]|uniref:DUF3618 domain-containing protein n=1 Tax=Azospirillum melinis TaxID=328839 RepID=A0ABX2KEV9_9PROT|nr:hypothetical protein [Azospirillum melinis]MBP2306963.1 ElaB/YqjD/DUF883 family membrane-anchored ribosome-binding protein [Azospirillum melinis]NUB02133.1 hypothetical protein [Azospirillum melinis]